MVVLSSAAVSGAVTVVVDTTTSVKRCMHV